MTASDQPVVTLILGMHRSGTSLVARLASRLGAHLGGPLLNESYPDNPDGYWEHGEVVEIHEALLADLDRTWYGPQGHLPLPPDWQERPETIAAAGRLAAILRRELAAGGGRWAVKDPRLVRFLPLWRRLIAEAGAGLRVILCVRHPDSVSASLAARNRMGPEQARAIWLAHNHDALFGLAGADTTMVEYDTLLADPPATIRRLAAALLPAVDEAAVLDAAAMVRSDRRHHQATGSEPARDPVDQTYQLLKSLAAAPVASAETAHRAALEASLSWRLTAPLRRLLGIGQPRDCMAIYGSVWWDLTAPLRLAGRLRRLLGGR